MSFEPPRVIGKYSADYISKLAPIPGFEGKYSVSVDGEVYSHITQVYLKNRFVDVANSYVSVGLTDGKGSAQNKYVHRLVAAGFLGLDLNDSKTQVDHKNLNTHDNRLENLRLLSPSQNNLARSGGLDADTLSHKLCRKCGILKLRACFSINTNGHDGLTPSCRECNNKYYAVKVKPYRQ